MIAKRSPLFPSDGVIQQGPAIDLIDFAINFTSSSNRCRKSSFGPYLTGAQLTKNFISEGVYLAILPQEMVL